MCCLFHHQILKLFFFHAFLLLQSLIVVVDVWVLTIIFMGSISLVELFILVLHVEVVDMEILHFLVFFLFCFDLDLLVKGV